MAQLTVLDATILVAHFDDTDEHAPAARQILVDADRLAVSTLTLAEVVVGAAVAGRLQEQLDALAELEVVEVPIEAGAVGALARLRADTGLKMPDCCVLHAADVAGAEAIATRDDKLRRAAAGRGFETP